MEFKDRIKTLRSEKNYTTQQLGEILGKSDTAIRMWEAGRSKPDTDTIIKLANMFECTTDYLLGLSDVKNNEEKADIQNFIEQGHAPALIKSILHFTKGLTEPQSKELMGALGSMFSLLRMYADNVASANKSRDYILGDADKMAPALCVLNLIRNSEMNISDLGKVAISQPQVDAAVLHLREFVNLYTLYAFDFNQLKEGDSNAEKDEP